MLNRNLFLAFALTATVFAGEQRYAIHLYDGRTVIGERITATTDEITFYLDDSANTFDKSQVFSIYDNGTNVTHQYLTLRQRAGAPAYFFIEQLKQYRDIYRIYPPSPNPAT